MWRTIYDELIRWRRSPVWAVGISRKTEITVETDQVWIIRKSRSRRAWCTQCGREVDMVDLAAAGALSEARQNPLSAGAARLLPGDQDDRQSWHRATGADGTSVICIESVLKSP